MSKSKVTKKDAIIIFTDIRGFTEWSENIEVFQYSPELIEAYYQSLKSFFSDYTFKSLGDGALLIKTMDTVTVEGVNAEIKIILHSIQCVQKDFNTSCREFSKKRGQDTRLYLGWGITRGAVNEMSKGRNNVDYIGSNINKASRLCDMARPFGIVIDKEDFSDIGDNETFTFSLQKRRVKSLINPVPVWVTSEIAEAFHTRETLKETPEVHVAGFCYKIEDDKIKILLAYRNENRKLYPSKIEGCGGQLRYSETFEQGAARHFRQEMNITVSVHSDVYLLYSIQLPQHPVIPGVVFLCRYVEGEPSSKNHSKVEWVELEKIRDMDNELFIPTVKKEIFDLTAKLTG